MDRCFQTQHQYMLCVWCFSHHYHLSLVLQTTLHQIISKQHLLVSRLSLLLQ